MRFVPCASADEACLTKAIKANLERIGPLFQGMKRVFILQMDELASEERARFCKETDEVSETVNQCMLRARGCRDSCCGQSRRFPQTCASYMLASLCM